PADCGLLDAAGAADIGQRRAIPGRQRVVTAERLELRHARHADEDRIDRHRADGRVRRLLTRRHLVERQQLEHAQACGSEPGRDRFHIADVADSPAFGGGAREQRDEKPRPPAAGRRAHGRLTRQSKSRSTRAMPAAKVGGGGSRLTTRNDSRGKSKKYPGWTSTSSASMRSTRSSSGSSDGTCSTAYQPPSLRKTPHVAAASAS